MKKTNIKSFLKIGVLASVLVLIFLPLVHAQDYLEEGRLTKRTPEMEGVFDEIYNRYPENYIFNAMDFVQGYLKPESWTTYAFLSARDSFEKKVGTCTETSVLYCTMMRYRGIPCSFRVMQVNTEYADMFPVIYLDGSWYYPEKKWRFDRGTYWALS
ncbi:MAG: transglutaminase domain-containing protein, partial [Candidatus Brocadiales bacterium]